MALWRAGSLDKSIKSFEAFEIWKKGREIARLIYDFTGKGRFAADFELRNQIRRAAVSNIAEGHESQTHKTFIRHLGIAKGSIGEGRSQLYIALDQRYIAEFQSVNDLCRETSRQIAALIRYLHRSSNQ